MNGAHSSKTIGRSDQPHVESSESATTFTACRGKSRPQRRSRWRIEQDCSAFPEPALPICGNPAASPASRLKLQLVGKNSDHPDMLSYNNDRNNFGPAVGLSWSLPWGGKDKTVLARRLRPELSGSGFVQQQRLACSPATIPDCLMRKTSRLSESARSSSISRLRIFRSRFRRRRM